MIPSALEYVRPETFPETIKLQVASLHREKSRYRGHMNGFGIGSLVHSMNALIRSNDFELRRLRHGTSRS